MNDHYQTLGVAKTATADEIKAAYRKLASKHHPDRGGDTKAFQDIQLAYDTLADPQRRQQYDHASTPHQPHLNDIFNMFSNGFPQGRVVQQYNFVLQFTLDQVLNPVSKTLQLNTPRGQQFIEITIPAGAEHGQVLRYDNVIPDSVIFANIIVHQHPYYNRQGNNLHSTVQIDVFDLIVGTTISFNTIYGTELAITVPPATAANSEMRLPGHGIRTATGNGDQYILLQPVIPAKISDSLLSEIKKEQLSKKASQ